MMTLGRKKKAEDEKNMSTPQDAKKTGFFRKNEKTPETPPISTPDSSKSSKEKVRPTMETIEVPSAVPTPGESKTMQKLLNEWVPQYRT
jgi:hypothetical protein